MNQIQRWKSSTKIRIFKSWCKIFRLNKTSTERWNEWTKHNWLDTSMLHSHLRFIRHFMTQKCVALLSLKDVCMLGHAKDEFQDDLTPFSTLLALAQRGQFWTAWFGNMCFLSFDWEKRGVSDTKFESKIEIDMKKGLVLLTWLKWKRAALEKQTLDMIKIHKFPVTHDIQYRFKMP